MAELADMLRSVADGGLPATGKDLTVVTPPDDRSVGVLAFAGHNVVSADVSQDWVHNWLPDDDLSAPLQPPFLTVLASAIGRSLDNLDMVLVAPATGRSNGMELTELTEFVEPLHPRLARALAQRIGVRAWHCPGGLLTLGRGVGGRWEVSIEVEAALRGFGLGRGLFTAARGILPVGEYVWAQVAPGNAASVRAALAAGFRPVGAEVLLRVAKITFGQFTWFEPPDGQEEEPAQRDAAGELGGVGAGDGWQAPDEWRHEPRHEGVGAQASDEALRGTAGGSGGVGAQASDEPLHGMAGGVGAQVSDEPLRGAAGGLGGIGAQVSDEPLGGSASGLGGVGAQVSDEALRGSGGVGGQALDGPLLAQAGELSGGVAAQVQGEPLHGAHALDASQRGETGGDEALDRHEKAELADVDGRDDPDELVEPAGVAEIVATAGSHAGDSERPEVASTEPLSVSDNATTKDELADSGD